MPIYELTITDRDKIRFWRFLARDYTTGCLIFSGAKSSGYGAFRIMGMEGRRITVGAHKIAFLVGGGIISPERPHVLHNCPSGDNPACCEFAHLWAGDDADNRLDMARKNRGVSARLDCRSESSQCITAMATRQMVDIKHFLALVVAKSRWVGIPPLRKRAPRSLRHVIGDFLRLWRIIPYLSTLRNELQRDFN